MPIYHCVCGKTLKSDSGIYRHKKRCEIYSAVNSVSIVRQENIEIKRTNEKLQESNDALNDKLNEANERIKELVSENKELSKRLFGTLDNNLKFAQDNLKFAQDEVKTKNKQLDGAGNIIGSQNKSLIKLLHQHAADAPVLEYTISDDTMKKQIKGTDKINIGMVILNHFVEGNLHSILGDVLVAYYQEDDIKQQSIWSTDVARLTYLIKDITDKGGSIWTQDKKGNKVMVMIIKPLLLKVKAIIETFYEEIRRGEPTQLRIKVEGEAIKLLHEIGYKEGKNVSVMANKINKHIASHMHFENKHKQKLEN